MIYVWTWVQRLAAVSGYQVKLSAFLEEALFEVLRKIIRHDELSLYEPLSPRMRSGIAMASFVVHCFLQNVNHESVTESWQD